MASRSSSQPYAVNFADYLNWQETRTASPAWLRERALRFWKRGYGEAYVTMDRFDFTRWKAGEFFPHSAQGERHEHQVNHNQ